MTRVTDISTHALTLANLQRTQDRATTAQVQVGSGKTAQQFSEIPNATTRLLDLQTGNARTDQFVGNIDVADQRLQFMETATSNIFTVATNFRTELINALNMNNGKDLSLAADAQNMLDSVAGQLNTQQNGRYLFAGGKTDTRPVDVNDPNYLNPMPGFPTSPDTNYYKGDNQVLSVQADIGLTVKYGVTADNPAFEQIARALKIITAAGTPPSAGAMNEALIVVNQALDGLPGVTSQIGQARKQLTDLKAQHQDLQTYTQGAIGDIENVDITTAMTNLNQDQLTLQASYMVIAAMRNLTLTKYL